ncbi:hypothetical protein SAMN02745724_00226 [Pseudoalteromonas denitrificans DSM 6059]|uniref:Uncharacterized protein n=1 Tax=Pseudoalteromonas denitrificans DSM 6059 TaxID=1123010 RepID=A0A1I1E6P5_9GAMM|nr:hypothetical protein SAMN02745724_00226 [Pseudoalteromonas denitrificans DSM 6059]
MLFNNHYSELKDKDKTYIQYCKKYCYKKSRLLGKLIFIIFLWLLLYKFLLLDGIHLLPEHITQYQGGVISFIVLFIHILLLIFPVRYLKKCK